MNQIYRLTVCKGVLSVAACLLMAGCVDDKYDLTDIDFASRVTVKDLTVPINLKEITLDKVINFDDNENITTIIVDGKECYALQRGGNIETSDFNIRGIHVAAPRISELNYTASVPYNAPTRSGVAFDVNLAGNLEATPYNFSMSNIDPALLALRNVKTKQPIKVEMRLAVNPEFATSGNSVAFKDVKVKMPWGLITDTNGYNSSTGELYIDRIEVGSDGVASYTFNAYGIELGDNGNIVNNSLDIAGEVGLSSAVISFNLSNASLPSNVSVKANFNVSAFDVASFSGRIDYKMDNISIAPISLSDLPDFLDSPETEIRIADPSILVYINNPVGQYGIEGFGKIRLVSNFNGGNTTTAESDRFTIGTDGAAIDFCTKPDSENCVMFNGLGDILANSDTGGLPGSITVNLEDLEFAGETVDFPLATIDKAVGEYTFTAPLGFGKNSKVVYETTEDGWNSEDLDKVNIEKLGVSAKCSTNLPVGISLHINPIDKNGNIIAVDEDSNNFSVEPNSQNKDITLIVKGKDGKPITNFDGIRFRAVITQDGDNTQAIGPDLFIKLSDLRVKVDGYYDVEF